MGMLLSGAASPESREKGIMITKAGEGEFRLLKVANWPIVQRHENRSRLGREYTGILEK
jgi:hypothetical protein